ncbi:hypothetical protein DERP_014453 [Dermatophagoides pteronyssinus]|uniref:Uncharacterized protein n=1 Tax=Dermatophagoides pteronyssinus TaxID=6956 RepID=A0ABQ8IW62_DERPT|nr:hypothetical protein DERP_014453 [Dermatophagoides pteronyssinus]
MLFIQEISNYGRKKSIRNFYKINVPMMMMMIIVILRLLHFPNSPFLYEILIDFIVINCVQSINCQFKNDDYAIRILHGHSNLNIN